MSAESARTRAGHGRDPHDRGSSSALTGVKPTLAVASDRRWPVPVASARGVKPRIPEVEEDGFADGERVHLLHRLLHLRRWFPLFTCASRLLGGEVDRHRPGAAVVTHQDGAEDVGPALPPSGWIIGHQLTRAVRVARTTLHDLHEAGPRGVTGSVDPDRGAVVEHRLAGEQRRRPLPPRRLLRPVTVLPRRL